MPVRPDYDDCLIHSGRYFTAEWYYTQEGCLPALEYYEALPEVDRDRFDDLIRYLCPVTRDSLIS